MHGAGRLKAYLNLELFGLIDRADTISAVVIWEPNQRAQTLFYRREAFAALSPLQHACLKSTVRMELILFWRGSVIKAPMIAGNTADKMLA